MGSDLNIATVARDATSNQGVVTKKVNHPLDRNTDFSDLWYGRNGAYRYYLSNNLIKKFKEQQYENTSFDIYGKPSVVSFGAFSIVKDWKLPYRSTIVWPIRYIPGSEKWPPDELKPDEKVSGAEIWGFLCIDCNSSNAFDDRYAPELGAGFADALYTLFAATKALAKS